MIVPPEECFLSFGWKVRPPPAGSLSRYFVCGLSRSSFVRGAAAAPSWHFALIKGNEVVERGCSSVNFDEVPYS